MIPETGQITAGDMTAPEPAAGAMDAITRGTVQGVELLANIVAMLIVLVALVHLVNLALGLLPEVSVRPITLQRVMGAAHGAGLLADGGAVRAKRRRRAR